MRDRGVRAGGGRGGGGGGGRIREAVTTPSIRQPSTVTDVPTGKTAAVVGSVLLPNAVREVTSTVTATPLSVVTVHRPASTALTVPRRT
jgi:hypothetical protein